jgi:hypothetical protein
MSLPTLANAVVLRTTETGHVAIRWRTFDRCVLYHFTTEQRDSDCVNCRTGKCMQRVLCVTMGTSTTWTVKHNLAHELN